MSEFRFVLGFCSFKLPLALASGHGGVKAEALAE